jgi:hypothetical protein
VNTTHRPASGAKRKYQADPAAIYKLMSRIQLFTPEELTRLQIPIRVSFEAIKSGRGTHSDYQDLADAINCAMIRAESIDPMAESMVLRARDAMLRVLDRFRRTNRWGFDGPAITEVEDAVEFHEQLLRLSTPQQMIDAMKEVHRRCARGFGASSQAEVTA